MSTSVQRPGLNPEQVRQFKDDGVIALGRVLSDEETAEARHRFDALFAHPEERGPHLRDLLAKSLTEEDQRSHTGPKLLNLVQVWTQDEFYRSLLYRPELLDIVEAVIGPDIRLYHDQAFNKPPLHGGPVHFHQDNAYWGCEPAELVSIWIALDDADQENGCLWMLPGSHKLGLLPHGRSDSILLELDIDRDRLVPFEMPAGHALMHHCLTVHGSHPNRSERPRRAHAIHYMPAHTKVKDAMPQEGGMPYLRRP